MFRIHGMGYEFQTDAGERMELKQVFSDSEIETARTLFLEYAASLGFDLCFQNFDQELRDLPGDYAPPAGRLLIAMDGDQVLGCIALRRIDAETCEMKRLYVRPAARGRRLGRTLSQEIITEARSIGYLRMRLDTMPTMTEAISLYQSLGFKDITPYRYNPMPGAIYMELDLTVGS